MCPFTATFSCCSSLDKNVTSWETVGTLFAFRIARTNDSLSQKIRYNTTHVLPPEADPSVMKRDLCLDVIDNDAIFNTDSTNFTMIYAEVDKSLRTLFAR